MPERAKPIGVLETGDDLPGFRQVLCDLDGTLVTPIVDRRQGTIVEFEPAGDLDLNDIVLVECKPATLEVGDAALYAYKFPLRKPFIGRRIDVSLAIVKGIRRLSGFPFARLEAAAFLHDHARVRRYVREATTAYVLSNDGATIGQIRPILSRYLTQNSQMESIYAEEFCRGMLRYYRLYRNLLYVADPGTRRKYRRRFDTASRFILPFLLDSDFLTTIENEALHQAPSVSSFRSAAGHVPEDVVNVLARLGVSRARASRFALSDSFSPTQLSLFNHTPENIFQHEHTVFDRAGVVMPLTYRAIDARHEVTDAVGRLDKKLKKKRADFSFASLAYGLLLVVQSDVIGTALMTSTRDFGLQAIRTGLGSLAYRDKRY